MHMKGLFRRMQMRGLVRGLEHKKPSVRLATVKALPDIEPLAEEVVLALMKATVDEDDRVARSAEKAIRRIGSAAVPALVQGLENEDAGVRATAAQALGFLGPAAEGAVPALAKAIEDEYDGVRHLAVQTLSYIGPAAQAAVPALVKALDDEDMRGSAVYTLLLIDPAARRIGPEGVPSLIGALSDIDKRVCCKAARILRSIGPAAKAAVPALKQVLEDTRGLGHDKEQARAEAAGALGSIGPAAQAALPALMHALDDDDDSSVRFNAALALAKIRGEISEERVVALIEALGDEDDPFKVQAAAEALGEIGLPAASAAILPLYTRLGTGGQDACFQALDKLVVGPGAPILVGSLCRFIRSIFPREEQFALVLQFLRKVGVPAAVKAIIAYLQSGGGYKQCPLNLLAEFGPEAAEAVPVVTRYLDDDSDDWTSSAAFAFLREVDVPAGLQAVIGYLERGGRNTLEALWAVGRFGSEAADAVPVVTRYLDDSDDQISSAAQDALAAIRGISS